MANVVMRGRDAVFASLAECFVTLDGKRYNLMQAINVEAKMEKTKTEVPILGKTGMGNKATGWKGTGSCTLHYNQSVFRKFMLEYKGSGTDFYFDMQITNSDPTSAVGEQTIILKDCNLDDIILAKFEAGGEILDEEMAFTFEDWEIVGSGFTLLDGML